MSEYIVIAGSTNRPAFLKAQTIEKGSGQTVLAGDERVYELKPGDCGIPNRAEVWGRRLINGKAPKDEDPPIDVKDPRYKGEIEFLKWGDTRGMLIICRYLRGYQTLDLQYQNLILNADLNINFDDEATADRFFLRLLTGRNVFDDSQTDPLYIKMLQITPYNKNSKSGDPNSANYMFQEENITEDAEDISSMMNAKFEAIKIVNEASSDNSFEKIKNLSQILSRLFNEEPKEKDLYTALLNLADSNPDGFMSEITSFRAAISNNFEKLKIYKALDLTKNGIIAAGIEKFEIIGADIPAKGDKMAEWVFENFLDPKAYSVAYRISKIAENLK